MILVTITDPIHWREKCLWIEKHCASQIDVTNWGLWQIGQGDIEYMMTESDAMLYYLGYEPL